MLKKAAHIILAFYLLTTIVGFSVTRHYCGDRLVSTQIDVVDDCDCGCGCDMTCGMCEIETDYVHLGANFVVEQNLKLNPVFDFVVLPAIPVDASELLSQENNQNSTNDSLQILSISRRLALIQSFRC